MNNRLYGNLIFELSHEGRRGYSLPENPFGRYEVPAELCRKHEARLPECDEMTVVRHYTNHSANNFGVNNGFYPLGSCTMKYNPIINEEMAALPEFTGLHPLQPADTCRGALKVIDGLGRSLAALTGMSRFTLNPYAGAHGELTGLMIIRIWHEHRGDMKRTKVIVPDSAHGTNPASAAVCGLDVVEVKSRSDGTVDTDDLRLLLDDTVAAMMMTNPNTLGLFEHGIPEIARMVHECGAMMYYDGANLNPMLGVCRPCDMGFDVMHINLHKTFSTPHGGGGPGAGPVGVRKGMEWILDLIDNGETLKDNGETLENNGKTLKNNASNPGSIASSEADSVDMPLKVGAYHGNFGVLMRAYAYILTLGRENIRMVGPLATLNANYIKESLKDIYKLPIDGLCKHEFVFDGLKDKSTGVTTMDIAKRLLDYGYHAPTIYFPLLFHESLMIEPTENESKETIDGFIDVMRRIAEEAMTGPEEVKSAPHNTPIGRVDDVLAAKHPVVTYRQMQQNDRNA